MKHKKIISIVTAACMLSGLSLGGNALTVYADDEVKELVLWDHHTGKEFDFLVSKAEEYSEVNPDVHITVEQIPWDDYIGTKMATAFASGEGPDIFEVYPGSVLKYADAGILMPLNDYLTEEQLADFSEASIESVTVSDQIVAIPFEIEPLALYYDIDKFEEKGLEPPTTWDEMIEAAQALAEDDCAGITIETTKGGHQDFQWYPWLWQLGGSIYTEDQTGSALNDPKVAESLQLWRTMFETGAANLKPSRPGSEIAMLGEGETAMQLCGSWSVVTVEETYKDKNIGVVPLPIPEGGEQVTVAGGWKMGVNSQSEYAKEAADFVTWLWAGDTEHALEWCTEIKFAYSPRTSVTEAGGDIYTKGIRQVFTDILDTAIPEMRLPAEVVEIVEDMIQSAYFDQSITVEEATQNAHEELELFLSDYEGSL